MLILLIKIIFLTLLSSAGNAQVNDVVIKASAIHLA